MKVCVVGSGGREHSLAIALGRTAEVVVTPGNPGIPGVTPEGHMLTCSECPPEEIEADLFVIGPEAPLVEGLADRLRAKGRAVFGPGADGARLEGSKAYMKEILSEAGVPTARYGVFSRPDAAIAYLHTLPGPWVVKTDGLASGKGVLVTDSLGDAAADVVTKLSGEAFGEAGRMVVIEEGLVGAEWSLHVLCDGNRVMPLAAARDYKRVGDSDAGPNTGGMGSNSPVPFVDDDMIGRVVEECVEPLLTVLRRHGVDYRGVLYGGLMLTSDGPKVLEYNVRFGDPETQVILQRTVGDLTELLLEAASGKLRHDAPAAHGASVCVVLASEGYPGAVRTADPIAGIEEASAIKGVTVVNAGVAAAPGTTTATATGGGTNQLVTAGGRVLGITGLGDTLSEARRLAYEAVGCIRFKGMHHRHDIAELDAAALDAAALDAAARDAAAPRERWRTLIPRYSLPEMAVLFTDESKMEGWLEVELAAVDGWASVGVAPTAAAELVRSLAPKITPQFVADVAAREAVTDHDLAAFVDVVQAAISVPEGSWIHYGLTSSDVVDTALSSTLVSASDLLVTAASGLIDVLKARAAEHIATPMAGRTHGMHAEPTTFGVKLALWCLQVDRDRTRLVRAREGIAVGKLSGAVGTYSNIDPLVEDYVCNALGLRPVPATQVISRDRHAEFLWACASVGATVEAISTEIRHLARTELGEVEEKFDAGQKGSSSMPHKRNPVLSERLSGLARVLRGYVQPGLEDVALWHERDISHSSVERVILPDASLLAYYLLRRVTGLIEGLVVNVERMRENLTTGSMGLLHSQSVLLALVASGMDRDSAYRVVQRDARTAWEQRRQFREVLEADDEVVLDSEALDVAFDLEHSLRHTSRFLDALKAVEP